MSSSSWSAFRRSRGLGGEDCAGPAPDYGCAFDLCYTKSALGIIGYPKWFAIKPNQTPVRARARGNDFCQIVMGREENSESGKVDLGRVHGLPGPLDLTSVSWFREIVSKLILSTILLGM